MLAGLEQHLAENQGQLHARPETEEQEEFNSDLISVTDLSVSSPRIPSTNASHSQSPAFESSRSYNTTPPPPMSLSPSVPRHESGSFTSLLHSAKSPELLHRGSTSNANTTNTFTLPAQHYGEHVAAIIGRFGVEHDGAQAVHAFLFNLEKLAPPEMWKSFMSGYPLIGRDLSDEMLSAMEKDIQARARPVAIMQV